MKPSRARLLAALEANDRLRAAAEKLQRKKAALEKELADLRAKKKSQ